MVLRKRVGIFKIAVCCMLIFVGIHMMTFNTLAKSTTISVSQKNIKKKGAQKAIQEALTKAKKKATSKNRYVVKVAKGSYGIKGHLNIYSNTTLNLTGVTLKRSKTDNIIRVGTNDKINKGATGYKYKNIQIIGGTLDGNNKTGTMVKAAHTQNFSMNKTTMRNAYNAHIMELAAIKDVNLQNCNFKNQKVDGKKKPICFEAIQLDIVNNYHFNGYRAQPLAITNVKINKCNFENVPRGVGSHTSILNLPFKNISVTKCKFNNIKSVAIQGQNWVNCNISENTISNTPRGIGIYTFRDQGEGVYTASAIAKEGKVKTTVSSSYKAPANDQKIKIMNNTITLNSKDDPYSKYVRAGITISGTNITKSIKYSDKSGNIAKGNYYISGVTVSGNEIHTTGSGIRVQDARNSTMKNNTIDYIKNADSTNYYGIQLQENSNTTNIIGNTLNNIKVNGIYLMEGTSAGSISGNSINNAGKYGIDVEKATADNISKNIVNDSKSTGIFVYNGSNVREISGNKVSRPGKYGIAVEKSIVKILNYNTIVSAQNSGIRVDGQSSVESVDSNNIQ